MHKDLKQLLELLRARRRFDPELYLAAKTRLLNDYFKRSGLQACVLGVSGGVDSAMTLGLLQRASKMPGSPIEKIVCALMPMHLREGVTGQEEATSRGQDTVAALGGDSVIIDLSSSHHEVKKTVDQALRIDGDPWAAGQLVSNLRTPALYYASSLLTQTGLPAIVVGTTNRDEGSYIGYFGKAADGLVDLQPISDLHKSEVYRVARLLGVPDSVLNAIPTGDIYDGRNDEQLIGASYDAIELYTMFRCLEDEAEAIRLKGALCSEANAEFMKIAERLDTLNRQCAHKYLGGSPSAHLDVYPRAVPGGWRVELNSEDIELYLSHAGGFVAEFKLKEEITQKMERTVPVLKQSAPLKEFGNSVGHVQELLSSEECVDLLLQLRDQEWQPVGYNGMLKDYHEGKSPVGSYRATAYDKKFAKILWERISGSLPPVRILSENGFTDWDGDAVWRPVGVSPALRFIQYKEQGLLVPHYDAPFDYWDGRRTLMSLIIYLTDSGTEEGGDTRFILDPQRHLPFDKRDFKDWSRLAKSHEVYCSVKPKQGSALFFDHRILHDSEPLLSQAQKIVLRTDIVFERCGLRKKTPSCKSKALGFPDSSSKARQSERESLDARALSKINEDPYYRQVWERYGSRRKLTEAGFFDDGLPIGESYAGGDDARWLATPVDKILNNLEIAQTTGTVNSKWPAVLITTGGFSPVHKCHVEMLEKAKVELEGKGAVVLGGYLSPSHDNYVSLKSSDEMLDAHHRLRLCEQAVSASDWLMVDSWESLYCKTSLNFTAVVNRLERYLSAHIPTHKPLQVVYVFGSDNAGFSYVFLEQGQGVCVLRPGYEEKFRVVQRDPCIQECSRIYLVDDPTAAAQEVSSKQVRKGEESFLDERVLELFKSWKNIRIDEDRIPASYFMRNEQKQAISNWDCVRAQTVENVCLDALDDFRGKLLEVFKKIFKGAKCSGSRFDVDFKVLSLSDQRDLATDLTRGQKVISMDPFIEGDYNLAVSRCFQLSTGKGKASVVARPGHPSIQEQVQVIPQGRYILMDDDITTGATMKQVMSYLPEDIEVTQCLGLIKLSEQVREQRFPLDVLDFRDFLCGTNEGGLVVKLPSGQYARAPYALPYVSPAERASTPLSKNLEVSREIWKLNLRFFQSIQPQIILREVDKAFQNLMLYVGFEESDSLVDICLWHLDRFD